MSRPDDPRRRLDWEHGSLSVERLGAMLGPVTFRLEGGRGVEPLHSTGWAPEEAGEPPFMRVLRGEWPCVPFGYSSPVTDLTPPAWAAVTFPPDPEEEVHGPSSNRDWTWEDAGPGALALSVAYPGGHPIRGLRRVVRPDPAAPAIDLLLRIEARADCALPLGLHFTFRLDAAPGSARPEPGPFREGRTYPGVVEPGRAAFLPDRAFHDLRAVPGPDGPRDASLLPLDLDAEEVLQLNGVEGTAAVAFPREGFRARIAWDAGLLPSLLLWISNRGRQGPPWSGRHLALGMEPVRSPFGFGTATAAAENPLSRAGTPTSYAFRAGEVVETRYRLSAEPL